MKKIQLVSTVLLILAIVLSFSAAALAAGVSMGQGAAQTGSITIKNPVEKQSYYVYRIFDLETYDKDNDAYSYTLNDSWYDFATDSSVNGKYITLEESGGKYYVKWVEGADVNDFAVLALAWAKDTKNNISISDGISPATNADIVFRDLRLGYYLIDSSVGALCALTTNDPDAVVNEKNELTTVIKLVKENRTNDYVTENSAKLGDTVSFKSEITLGEGAENLVLHDIMSSYLALKPDSIRVYVQQSDVDPKYYSVDAEWVGADKVFHPSNDNCTFNITFDNAFIAGLNKGTVIRVEYDAVLEWGAKEWKTFKNEAWVTFGDKIESTHSTTATHTCSFDLIKTNDRGIAIQTAKFYLYDAQQGGNIIPLVALGEYEEYGEYRYRVATAEDNVSGNGAPIKAGYAYVYGLDKQVYYLEEIEQPTGFNKLASRVKVDLTNGDIKADTSSSFFSSGAALGSDVSNAGGLQVINKSGTVLPGTGGVGTTVLYGAGGFLAAAALILLVTKKRLNRSTRRVN